MGCNGVDNAALAFDHVALPRAALLDAASRVAPDGSFSSSVSRPRDRFLKVRACVCVCEDICQGECRVYTCMCVCVYG